jgi:hypothetical protein
MDFKPFLQNLVWSNNRHVSISSFSCVWCFADMYLCVFYMRRHGRHCFVRHFNFFKGVWCGLRVIWKWLKLCSSLRHFCLKVKKMSQTISKCLKLFCLKVTKNVSNYSVRRRSKMTCTYVCMSNWSFYRDSQLTASNRQSKDWCWGVHAVHVPTGRCRNHEWLARMQPCG